MNQGLTLAISSSSNPTVLDRERIPRAEEGVLAQHCDVWPVHSRRTGRSGGSSNISGAKLREERPSGKTIGKWWFNEI